VPGDHHDSFDERRPRGLFRGAPHRGTRTLAAILPNGRSLWLEATAPLAPAASLGNTARLAEVAAARQQAGAAAGGRAIRRLVGSVEILTARLSARRVERAKALRRRLVKGDAVVDRRLAKAVADFRTRVARQIRIDRESLARLRRRDWCDKAVIISSWPLFAAYGQRGRPFGANNVALTLALLTWLAGDEVVAALFGKKQESTYPVRDADVWSYVAPFANLLAGWWLMNDLQHERFVAGMASGFVLVEEAAGAPPGERHYEHATIVDLSRTIAPGHINDFRSFVDVPVVATVSRVEFSAAGTALAARLSAPSATVVGGVVMVTVMVITNGPVAANQKLIDALDVAWIVDTAEPRAVG
jgi:hypothetical protein